MSWIDLSLGFWYLEVLQNVDVLSAKYEIVRAKKAYINYLDQIPNTKKPKVSHTTYFVKLYEVASQRTAHGEAAFELY